MSKRTTVKKSRDSEYRREGNDCREEEEEEGGGREREGGREGRERRSKKRGGEFAGAWNPVISATKRAVHLAGAWWHVSTPSSGRRVIRSSWWTSRAACTLQRGGATMLQISTGEAVIYIIYVYKYVYVCTHVSPLPSSPTPVLFCRPCDSLANSAKLESECKN